MGSDKQLSRLVAEDKAIERKQDSAILALMEHRWKAVNEHGYSVREYAEALGRDQSGVRRYVVAWDLWRARDEDVFTTPADVLMTANYTEERREAVAIVADAYDIGPAQATRTYSYREEAKRVQTDIAEGAERLVGEGYDPAEARERAAQVVKNRLAKQRLEADLQADRREREKQNKGRAFRNLEYELMAMRQRGRNALQLARESDLDGEDELIEFIEDAIAKVRHTLELISLAIVGEAQIDWDAELAKLTDD